MKHKILSFILILLFVAPAIAEDNVQDKLIKAVELAKTEAKAGLRTVGALAQDLGMEKSKLPQLAEKLGDDSKNYKIQLEYIDAMLQTVIECEPRLKAIKKKIDEHKPDHAMSAAVTALEELAAYCDSRAAEAKRNVEAATRSKDKERYASLAESLERCARAYRADRAEWDNHHKVVESSFKGIDDEIEYCAFLRGTLKTIRNALELIQDGEQFAEEIVRLSAQLDGVTKNMADFAATIVFDKEGSTKGA